MFRPSSIQNAKRAGPELPARPLFLDLLLKLLGVACSLLTVALTSQGFLGALALTWFQVKGVPLDLLNNVFLLYLAFESAQCVLEGLTLLNSDFCQTAHTPKLVPFGPCSYCNIL